MPKFVNQSWLIGSKSSPIHAWFSYISYITKQDPSLTGISSNQTKLQLSLQQATHISHQNIQFSVQRLPRRPAKRPCVKPCQPGRFPTWGYPNHWFHHET